MSYVGHFQADLAQASHVAHWIAFAIRVLALIVLGYFSVVCLGELRKALEQKAIGIETSWGGLGGSLGGWTVSKSLTWFVATMVSFSLFLVLALHLHDGLESLSPAPSSSTGDQKKGGDTKNEPKPSPAANAAGEQSRGGANTTGGGKDSKADSDNK